MDTTPAAFAKATTAQLKAEIVLSEYGNVKAFAAALGVDYHTFRRYLTEDRDIKMEMLLRCLALLRITPSVFFSEVEARMQRPEPPTA